MALNEVALNAGANAIAALVTATSLHSADPGTTGANEIAGGTYARKTPAFGAAAAGVADLSAPLTFDVPGGESVAFYGHWDGVTFIGGEAVSTPETFGGDGTYELDSAAVKVQ